MARLTANEIVDRFENLESERSNLDGQLELLERYVMPGKGRFFHEGQDSEESIDWRHREIYDGTANTSLITLASNLHSSLTSPAAQWFNLRFRRDELNEDRESSAWLEEAGKRVMASLQDSNFNLEVNEFYQEGAGFGTAVMMHNETPGEPMSWNGHHFKAEMLRECFFEEDMEGRPFSLFIKRCYTPRQLEVKFGRAALPHEVIKRLDDETAVDKTEDVIRCIYLDPDKKDADVSKPMPPASRPYSGRYVLCEGRHFIGPEQGFYEFPAYVMRWARTAGSKYGHCPGMVALGDILTLQEMVELVRNATEKAVDPPMKTTRRGIVGDLELEAGGLTNVREMGALEPLLPPGAYRIDSGWADIQDLRQRVRQAFFVDQLELKESPQMTATEVQVRYEMMQRLLGPTLGRIQADFLDPLVERCFWMMSRKGALPEPPAKVIELGGDLDIEYVGPLARAQRMGQVDAITRWLSQLGQIAQLPGADEVLDVPDYDAAAKEIAEILGVPAKLSRSQKDIDSRRQQRSQAQQDAAMPGQLKEAGAGIKDLAQAMGGSSNVVDMAGGGVNGAPGSIPTQ